MSRILVVEDEARLAAFLERGLRSAGFAPTITGDGRSALRLAHDSEFDLVVLDLGLPGADGLSVLEEIRRRGERLPVIVLTARDDPDDRIAGLEAGADDYIGKPFHFDELLARIRARLRSEPGGGGGAAVLAVGGIELDPASRRVRVDGTETELSVREFELLRTFLEHPGQALSREQLLARVWHYDFDPASNVVDVYIGYLRRKLGSERFETVRGIGYRFVG